MQVVALPKMPENYMDKMSMSGPTHTRKMPAERQVEGKARRKKKDEW